MSTRQSIPVTITYSREYNEFRVYPTMYRDQITLREAHTSFHTDAADAISTAMFLTIGDRTMVKIASTAVSRISKTRCINDIYYNVNRKGEVI